VRASAAAEAFVGLAQALAFFLGCDVGDPEAVTRGSLREPSAPEAFRTI
jgi:hypothetical protein